MKKSLATVLLVCGLVSLAAANDLIAVPEVVDETGLLTEPFEEQVFTTEGLTSANPVMEAMKESF